MTGSVANIHARIGAPRHRDFTGPERQGAFGSTNRQRGRSGQASWSGRWAWQTLRPCWMRLTWASYIWSGSSMPRNRSWASSAEAFGPISPTRRSDPIDVPVDRHAAAARTRTAAAPRRSSCRCRRSGSASRAPRAPTCRRGTRASSRRVPRGSSRSVAWMRGAFWLPSPPGQIVSISSGSGANSTAAQSGATPSGSPTPPQPAPGLCGLRPRPCPGSACAAPRTPPRRRCPRCSGSGSSGSARWSGRAGAARSGRP